MNAGNFNTRISIEELNPEAEPDASGRVDESDDANWTKYFDCWARVMHHGGREFFNAKQVQADLSELLQVFYCRKTRDVTTKMRIRMRDRTLGILATYNVEERNEVVEIQCKEAA